MNTEKVAFSRYQVWIIAILAFLQFTIILDFMVLSPLGPFVMEDLHITTGQFAFVVSAYAFSAALSAILTAGFADRFDRKKLLLFFYAGFLLGTLFCALAPTYNFLLFARIFTGLFGGVINSIVFAIVTDLFVVQQRGRVMGFVQMSFAASQILGLPIGLYLANKQNWNFPFFVIVGVSLVAGVAILFIMRPITAHLEGRTESNPWVHFGRTLANRRYQRGFFASVLLATGGFMLMPFGTDFATKNLAIDADQLPILYTITGIASIIFGPLIGKLSDQFGRFLLFSIGSVITVVIVAIYTNMGPTAFGVIVVLNVLMFIGISGRMVPAQALMTSVPSPKDRGAFMSINSATQQISGGIAAIIAGQIIYHGENGYIHNYPILGYVVIASVFAAMVLMYRLNRMLQASAETDRLNDAKTLENIESADVLPELSE